MTRLQVPAAALVAALSLAPALARGAEPAACMTPRFSDIGWTDVTTTTALTTSLLGDLGYEPKVDLLSVAVTFQSLKNKDIDVFLGNWMPAQVDMRKPYLEGKSVEEVGTNLVGAKETLAVPTYMFDAGLKSFNDIAKFGDQLDHKIYGIETGSAANKLLGDMITKDEFGLDKFQLIESSEQGMLSEVSRRVRQNKGVVFLGWEPHPMNVQYKISYLKDGDPLFGANYGAATVNTLVRAGFTEECPNIGKFLGNLKFDLKMEDSIMQEVLEKGSDPKAAGRAYLKGNPAVLDAWLTGVTTATGEPGLPAVRKALGL